MRIGVIGEKTEPVSQLLKFLDLSGFNISLDRTQFSLFIEDLAPLNEPLVILLTEFIDQEKTHLQCTKLKRLLPRSKIIQFFDKQDIDNGMDMGVDGFFDLDDRPQNLISAIHAVCRGEGYMSPRLVKGIIKNAELEKKYKRFSTPKFSLEESLQTLLPREHEVLKKVLQGDSGEEIARQLGYSYHTVLYLRRCLYEKFQVRGKQELLQKLGPHLANFE